MDKPKELTVFMSMIFYELYSDMSIYYTVIAKLNAVFWVTSKLPMGNPPPPQRKYR